MEFEWDKVKSKANIDSRGLDFEDAVEMFAGLMIVQKDYRADYGEERFLGFGVINNRLIAIVYTNREPDITRIISFRKANRRERVLYEEEIKNRLGEG